MEIENPEYHVTLRHKLIKIDKTTLIPVMKKMNKLFSASHRSKALGVIKHFNEYDNISPSDYVTLRTIFFKYESTIKNAEFAGGLDELKKGRLGTGDELIVDCLNRELTAYDKKIENLRSQIAMSMSSDYDERDRPEEIADATEEATEGDSNEAGQDN